MPYTIVLLVNLDFLPLQLYFISPWYYQFRQEHLHIMPLFLTIRDLFDSVDQQLFHNILANPNYILYRLFPPVSCAIQHYNLQTRVHNNNNIIIIMKTGYTHIVNVL